MAQVPDIDVSTVSVGGSAYTVPFVYQNRAEVFVEVDGVSTTFTWINDGNISITPAPAAGAVVRRYRSTSALAIRHDYRNGVPFTPKNIAENNDQILFIAQEAIGTSNQATALAGSLSGDIADAIAAAAAAEASAATALGVANGTDAKATSALAASATATSTVNAALSTANTAKGIAEGIEGIARDARTGANSAIATADNAFAKALIAEGTANAIDAKAQSALDAAIVAVNTVGGVDGKAQTALNNAATALNNAATALSAANAAAAAVVPITNAMRVKSDNSVEFPGGIASGRAWADMTASRALATTYTNTTVHDIEVQVTGSTPPTLDGDMSVIVNGVTIVYFLTYAGGWYTESFTVPAGSTYRVGMTNATLNKWAELRR